MGKFQAGSRKAWSLTNQRTCCAVTLSQAGASASLPPSAQGEPLSSGRTPPSALPPRAVVRSEQIMDVRPRKGFCVMLININDLTCSRLLLPGPGPAASPRGGPGGAAGEPWTSRLPPTHPLGVPHQPEGILTAPLPASPPDFFPGPLPQPGLAGRRHGKQQRRDPARPQAGEVPAAPSRELRAVAQVCFLRCVRRGAGWDSGPLGRGRQMQCKTRNPHRTASRTPS